MALILGIQFFHIRVMLRDESDARDASHSQSTACEMRLKRHYVLSRRRGTFGVRTRLASLLLFLEFDHPAHDEL